MAQKIVPKNRMDSKGQIGVPQILSLLILIFVVFTVGRILFNASPLDPDSTDGGILANNQHGPGPVVNNSLMNIGFVVMSGILIISAMASIVIRFF